MASNAARKAFARSAGIPGAATNERPITELLAIK